MRKSTVKKTASKAPVVKEEITKTESTVSVKAETAEPEKKEETNAIVKQEAGTVVPVEKKETAVVAVCLLYTSPSPRDRQKSRMPSSA